MTARVSLCSDGKGGGCGKPVTGPRVSAHGPLDYGAFIGGGEFDALLKQSGYRANPVYGTGGVMHLECARAAGVPVPEGL